MLSENVVRVSDAICAIRDTLTEEDICVVTSSDDYNNGAGDIQELMGVVGHIVDINMETGMLEVVYTEDAENEGDEDPICVTISYEYVIILKNTR